MHIYILKVDEFQVDDFGENVIGANWRTLAYKTKDSAKRDAERMAGHEMAWRPQLQEGGPYHYDEHIVAFDDEDADHGRRFKIDLALLHD